MATVGMQNVGNLKPQLVMDVRVSCFYEELANFISLSHYHKFHKDLEVSTPGGLC